MNGPVRLGVGGPVAGGRQYVPWIHLDDVVGALLFCLDNAAASGAGTPLAAALHVCRTVCRRAERRALMVADANPEVVRYLNRLSDLLFILARAANGTAEPLWEPGASRDA